MIPVKPIRVMLGCEDGGWTGGLGFGGGGGGKLELHDKFFASVKESIPKELNGEIKEITNILITDSYSIFALQDFACNIIGKIHSRAKSGKDPYFNKIRRELINQGYGKDKKQLDMNDMYAGMIDGFSNMTESIVERMGGIVEQISQVITDTPDEGGTPTDFSSNISINNLFSSPKVPYKYDEENILKGMASIVNNWDVHFLSSWDKTTFLPVGLSVENGEILKKKVLNNEYTILPTYKYPTIDNTMLFSGPKEVPSLTISTQVATAAGGASTRKKKRKKKTRRKRKRSRRKEQRRHNRRSRRKALKKARSRRKR
jgi:hypothetical protein